VKRGGGHENKGKSMKLVYCQQTWKGWDARVSCRWQKLQCKVASKPQNPAANPSKNVSQPKQQQYWLWNIILCKLRRCKLQIYELHLMPPLPLPPPKKTCKSTSNRFPHEGIDLRRGSAPLAHKTGLQYGWQSTLISLCNVSNYAFSDLLTATGFVIFSYCLFCYFMYDSFTAVTQTVH